MKWDAFISHASEDKERVALPLKDRLKALGYRIWLDVTELKVGDELVDKIDEGLRNSRFGIVILSRHSYQKNWPLRELRKLLDREKNGVKVVLPVWHGIGEREVASLGLQERVAANTKNGLDRVASRLASAMGRPRPHWSTVAIWGTTVLLMIALLAWLFPILVGTGRSVQPVRIELLKPDSQIVPSRFRVEGRIEGGYWGGALAVNDRECPIGSFGRFGADLEARSPGKFPIRVSFTGEGTDPVTVHRIVVVDPTPPVIRIDWPKEEEPPVTETKITVLGRLEEANPLQLSISVDGEVHLVTPGSDGAFSHPVLLVADESTNLVFDAMDQAGNRAAVVRRTVTHRTPDGQPPPQRKRGRFSVPTELRQGPDPRTRTVVLMAPGYQFEVLREQTNGDCLFVRVRGPGGYCRGWVSSADVSFER